MFRSVRRWIAYVLIIGAVVGVTGMIALAATAPRRDFNDDFTITSFDARYELERSGDRLDVLVTETIATDFAGSMNHGIIRAIPRKYQSHVNEITDVRVDGRLRTHTSYSYGEDEETPKQWHPVQVKEDYTGTVLSLKIGSASEYLLEGEQFYRISYRLTDVAMNTPNGKAQEVYLDVNGSGWDVPTDRVTAELIVPADLTDRLNGNAACYQGAEGSTAVCTISRSGTDPVTFTASATDLNAWQSMTFAVGFVPDTFPVAYTPERFNVAAIAWLLAAPAIGLLVLACVVVPQAWRRWRLSRPVLVTQFQPPEGIEPLVAADVWGRPERGPAAQLIDAAVRKQVELTTNELPGSEAIASGSLRLTGSRRRALNADLRVEGLDELDDRGVGSFLRGYFRHGFDRAPSDSLIERRRSLIREAGQRTGNPTPGSWFMPMYVILVLLSLLATIAVCYYAPGLFWWMLASAIGAVLLLIAALYRSEPMGPLTTQGRQTFQHLRGLHNFMSMSEQDRIAWLQNAQSAPRVKQGDATLVTLYEPLLPYALIFGMEDTWTKVIGELHDARLPDTDPLAALLTAMPLSDLSASLTHNGYRSIDGTQTMMDVNHRVSDGFSNAGTALSDTFSGSNDGSGGSGWSGGGGGGGWSSGGSGGGGSSGGGMGGGGGSSW